MIKSLKGSSEGQKKGQCQVIGWLLKVTRLNFTQNTKTRLAVDMDKHVKVFLVR